MEFEGRNCKVIVYGNAWKRIAVSASWLWSLYDKTSDAFIYIGFWRWAGGLHRLRINTSMLSSGWRLWAVSY